MGVNTPTTHVQSDILINPVRESATFSRSRTFTLAQLRKDYRDVQTQFIVLLTQLHNENFTGQLQFNFKSGNVCDVDIVQSEKILIDPTK